MGMPAVRSALRVLRDHPALVALTLLAAALRFATLDVQSFGHDEAITAGRVVLPDLRDTLAKVATSETTPPLYYVVAWAWSKPFGTGEVGLRALSALAGTAVVPVAYGAARELVSRRAGLVAAALVATNPMLVWYSQEARSYSLLVLLTAVSFLLFAIARQRPSARLLAGWAAVSALALATHYFALFVVVPEAIWLLARAGNRRRALTAVGAVVAAGLVLLPLAVEQATGGKTVWIAAIPLGERLIGAGAAFLVGDPADHLGRLAIVAGVAAGLALTLLVVRADRAERRGGLVALAIGGIALACPLALALAGADYFLARNLLPALVPLIVAVAAGLGARRARGAGLAVAGALCALFAATVVLTAARPDLQRADWRQVAVALGDARERRLIVGPRNSDQPLDFYLRRSRQLPDEAGAWTREVVVFGWPRPAALAPDLPSGFRRVNQETEGAFDIARFRATKPMALSSRRLSATEVGAPAQGSAAVVLQTPARR
jgi:mannosyltransferase